MGARRLKLGFMMHGNGTGWGDWRHPAAHPGASTDFGYYRRQAQVAEAAKFDFLFVADSVHITPKSSPHYLNRFEPLTILSALAAVTDRIGLVGTLTVSYAEPYNVARQFASLDHISGGRAGWNVVTSWLEGSARNFSRDKHYDHATRYRLAAEHLDVVQGLWDSWEDDALVHDKASGRFFDPEKLHRLDHRGPFFQVEGPLNIARSPQGQPVIFQAGASEDGRNFAAARSDAIFVQDDDLLSARAYYADVKRRAAGFGRNPADLFVLPGLRPVIGSTEEEAERKYRDFIALTSIEDALLIMARSFNEHDFSQYDLDAPFPEVERFAQNSNRSTSGRVIRLAREGNLTLRETAQRFATPRTDFVGTPEQVADAFERWFLEPAADGFVYNNSLPDELSVFAETVIPILQDRGLFRREYEGTTFRDSLGLAKPVNRHTSRRIAAE
ncbi:LLM class flavin-dependent oxidoreductase [Paracoccus denitrificans]|jgi:FMN-dependent oxidoreductase (nitrilotriacetate monooxygenase family)|uniref:Monooxygenase, NtaA/SnaA/SoxA family n=1 Tax=Paracoccus denitrificans (strain Pd 1222) TaxID=318586 RepID=A1BC23_PARDP|nr:LLM class flavin-dependent oxidoreductase [Paracoccus denitrificans]ABL73067.1 monooxygenase, NtaA/SnaA/SoxA family [Paracoccus denitrificans PD1222]MBB4628442.1 FMN-dependent oxidoreductase (nitrilotriacetate monooxygenase family) [Paracoccus denitrificans]MCU7429653.1 LLM class flavin-dependent oxidoreductase [Paracoccus denitrificans]QAR29459.1 LLM class flavin-dependent oxidoreductase [Paracoccus denitrificans]UPV98213.1 LLM class flavin-dependent oxidoreductase [Paracoccus denitrifican